MLRLQDTINAHVTLYSAGFRFFLSQYNGRFQLLFYVHGVQILLWQREFSLCHVRKLLAKTRLVDVLRFEEHYL